MPENIDAFKNIENSVKTVSRPIPQKINDTDLSGSLYNNIIDQSENGVLDLNSLTSFTSISQSRDDICCMIDVMCEDPVIQTQLQIYVSDVCEPNPKGNIIWQESDDQKIQACVNSILDQLDVEKNQPDWVSSFIKYGDLYLKLLRKSEYNKDLFANKTDETNKLNENLDESITIKAFKKTDHFQEHLEIIKNPAEVFDLQRFGKTCGYIRSHVVPKNIGTDSISSYQPYTKFNYQFNLGDIDLYPATDFVHACLSDGTLRNQEEVSIFQDDDENEKYTYSVKRGQSLFYNVFRIWRELSLLENSVLLNRVTKSSIVRTVSIEVGDMETNDVGNLLHRIKSLVEQKSAINVGHSYEDYTNPGPMENIIYIPTHDGKGAITVGEIGGQTITDNLNDLNYFKDKLATAIGIPKQYLGLTDDAQGFNGGSSLSLLSSKYQKTVKKIQNLFSNCLTDAINLILYDRGLTGYINKFRVRMQPPTTQEEKDRRDQSSSEISTIQTVMGLLVDIQDPTTRLEILKSLLSTVIQDSTVTVAIQDEIDRIKSENVSGNNQPGEAYQNEEIEEPEEQPDIIGDDIGNVIEAVEDQDEQLLTEYGSEDDTLPTWEELGVSYNDN